MGFLQKFFANVFHESGSQIATSSSFDSLSEEEVEVHLNIATYGNFRLTEAVRPSYDLQVRPCQAYRHDTYLDEETGSRVPVLMAAASKEILFELFIEMIQPLGEQVDVVLETSHNGGDHEDLYREHIDMPVLTSALFEFEDQILNDGCTGIAVLNPNIPREVQFDEHKLLIVYGSPLEKFERILERNGVPCDEDVKFITEGEHVHSTCERYIRQFEQLKTELGMDTSYVCESDLDYGF